MAQGPLSPGAQSLPMGCEAGIRHQEEPLEKPSEMRPLGCRWVCDRKGHGCCQRRGMKEVERPFLCLGPAQKPKRWADASCRGHAPRAQSSREGGDASGLWVRDKQSPQWGRKGYTSIRSSFQQKSFSLHVVICPFPPKAIRGIRLRRYFEPTEHLHHLQSATPGSNTEKKIINKTNEDLLASSFQRSLFNAAVDLPDVFSLSQSALRIESAHRPWRDPELISLLIYIWRLWGVGSWRGSI